MFSAVEVSIITDIRRVLSELDRLTDMRKDLETKRLDLDFAKRRSRNASNDQSCAAASISQGNKPTKRCRILAISNFVTISFTISSFSN